MNTSMCHQPITPRELLITKLALIRLLFHVCLDMVPQCSWVAVSVITYLAGVRAFSGVGPGVVGEMAGGFEGLGACGAFIRAVFGVDLGVSGEVALLGELFVAFGALVRCFLGVDFDVDEEVVVAGEGLGAIYALEGFYFAFLICWFI